MNEEQKFIFFAATQVTVYTRVMIENLQGLVTITSVGLEQVVSNDSSKDGASILGSDVK